MMTDHVEISPRPPGASVAPLVAGRFTLTSRIGSGRFGKIYEGIDSARPGRSGQPDRLAIQIIDEGILDDPKLRTRFSEGFARIRSWSHPNIVRQFSLTRWGDSACLTMELLEGASMRRILDDPDPESLEFVECLAVVGQVGRALAHAHQRGVIHGAVDARNVFVTHDYEVKLLDFAPIPVSPSAALQRIDTGIGVREMTVRDDVNGLACLAYELLSGRHPFGGSLPDEARRAGIKAQPVETIPAVQWEALRRALDLTGETSLPTVSRFLEEFGVTGNERLPVTSQSAGANTHAPRVKHARSRKMPGARVDPPRSERPGVGQVAALADEDPVGRTLSPVDVPAMQAATRSHSQRPRGRLALATLLLIGLIALPNATVGPLPATFAAIIEELRLLAGGDPLPVTPVEPVVSAVETATGELDDGGTAGTEARDDNRESAAVMLAESTPRAEIQRANEPAAIGASEVVLPAAQESARPALDIARGAVPDIVSEAAAGLHSDAAPDLIPETAVAGNARPTDAAAAGPAGIDVATVTFASTLTTVSESGTAARVIVVREGPAIDPIRFSWWAHDDTARRNDDYGDLGQRIDVMASGETSTTLLIPIVADNRPEARERFFVSLSVDPADGSAGRTLPSRAEVHQAEVHIVDDDS